MAADRDWLPVDLEADANQYREKLEVVEMGVVLIVAACVACAALVTVLSRHIWLALQNRTQVQTVRRPKEVRALILHERLKQLPATAGKPSEMGRRRPLVKAAASRLNGGEHERTDAGATTSAGILDGVLQGSWAGATVLKDLAAVDAGVYEAMSQLAGKQLDTIADIHHYMDANWASASLGQSLPEAALRKLMGHLAEPMVKEHLERLGVTVEAPVNSNQAGWDYILNGEHEVNVKTVADFSSLANHFNKYPDIPVVVPADMAGIPENAIWIDSAGAMDELGDRIAAGYEDIVLVDPDLSYGAALAHAHAVGDAAMGHVDAAAGIPVFTAVISGVREFGLLKEGDTDVAHALKNMGLDVTGTGLGGLGGAKAGAALGTLIAPGVGTAIGATIGAVAGAIFGRKMTNSVKEAPLEDALSAYRAASEHAMRCSAEVEASAKAAYERRVQEEKARIEGAANKAKQQIQVSQSEAKRVVEQGYSLSRQEADALVEQARGELRAHAHELRGWFAREPWVRRVLWPDAATVVLARSIHELEGLERRLDAAANAILAGAPKRLDPEASVRLLQALLAVDAASDVIAAFIARFETERRRVEAELRTAIEQSRSQVIMLRASTKRSIANEVTRLRTECQQRLNPVVRQVKAAADVVRVEARRLGRTA